MLAGGALDWVEKEFAHQGVGQQEERRTVRLFSFEGFSSAAGRHARQS